MTYNVFGETVNLAQLQLHELRHSSVADVSIHLVGGLRLFLPSVIERKIGNITDWTGQIQTKFENVHFVLEHTAH